MIKYGKIYSLYKSKRMECSPIVRKDDKYYYHVIYKETTWYFNLCIKKSIEAVDIIYKDALGRVISILDKEVS